MKCIILGKRQFIILNVILAILIVLMIHFEWHFNKNHRRFTHSNSQALTPVDDVRKLHGYLSQSNIEELIPEDDVPKLHGYVPQRPPQVRNHPRARRKAKRCPKDKSCSPPDCHCSKRGPGRMRSKKIPQLVLLTFDDQVRDLNIKLYEELFSKKLVNPNGCPIRATFFVDHFTTDYTYIQNLYADGHEIGSHTVTHSEEGHLFSKEEWMEQIQGQREILSAYGGVRMEDIRGFRAPYLNSNTKLYDALFELNFTYDSTLTAPFLKRNRAPWPFTLDYKIEYQCDNCPVESYPGLWEVPLVYWPYYAPEGYQCSMIDQCKMPGDTDQVYEILFQQFQRFYLKNRAPFGLFVHSYFFKKRYIFDAYLKFIEELTKMDDVWFVTVSQAIQWMKYPTPVTSLGCFKPFSCDYPERPPRCSDPKTCEFMHNGENVVLRTCQACPSSYPWLGNTGVVEKQLDRIPQELFDPPDMKECNLAT